jgi:hypothetical protein
MRPVATRSVPETPALQLPGQDSNQRKSNSDNGEGTHQDPLAHALPTSHGQDPDFALIVAAWDRLPEAVRAGIVAMVKAASGK